MKIVPVKKDGENYHIKFDILQFVAWVLILALVFLGVFPWWVFLFYPLSTIRGISIKFRLEK